MVMRFNERNYCPTTVDELWQGALRTHKDKPCIGVRNENDCYSFMSFKAINYHVKCCSSTLSQLAKGRSMEVGVWGAKCPALMLSVLACARVGIAYAPISHSLPSYAVNQVVEQSGMFLMFASESDLVQVAKTLQRTKHSIEFVVYWGRDLAHYTEEMEEMRKARVTIYHYSEFLEMGHLSKDKMVTAVAPNADLAVVYRMGEKGEIYGDRFTHEYIVNEVIAYGESFKSNRQDITSKDIALSSLALDDASHLIAELFLIHRGVRIGYNSYNSGSLISDSHCLQPTLLLSGGVELRDLCQRLNGKHRNAIGYSCIDQATSFSAKRDGIKAVTENIRSRSISDQSKESCHESFNSFGKIQSGTESFTERTIGRVCQGKVAQVGGPMQAMCEYIEGIYRKSLYVRGISIYQEDENESLSALVVPNNRQLSKLARMKKIDSSCSENAAILDMVLEDLRQMGQKAGLRQFEMIETLSFTSPETSRSA